MALNRLISNLKDLAKAQAAKQYLYNPLPNSTWLDTYVSITEMQCEPNTISQLLVNSDTQIDTVIKELQREYHSLYLYSLQNIKVTLEYLNSEDIDVIENAISSDIWLNEDCVKDVKSSLTQITQKYNELVNLDDSLT
ncbi:hypothetical protein [Photobacterium sp. GB-72]|uniref:hypothetical protein n=1 Tax=Photobacterium sp. GB-72 TaxID=2022105 RepID=UPI000D178BCF|nr:hypothetical protein [Photobacterium sp. GB-72]PSV26263.1 hypothetical protein C9J40_21515 [Photobacterium sp. GB-72]